MTGRRALVTGSARGIGRAVAQALTDDGVEVVGVDVAEGDDGPCVRTIHADLGAVDGCRRVLAEAGTVDVLVNNAAVLFRTPLEDFSADEFDRTVAVNLRAVFLLCQGLAPAMAERGWGRIVNVSSIGARDGRLAHGAAYAATKAGVLAITRSLARRFGPDGVTVNAVAPGGVETEMLAGLADDARRRYLDDIPAGRFCAPEEVAAAVAFLAGDRAAFVNGATLDVNGGWYAP
jgi:NAD(P)-dependent dehydrogenase (short-subunit alcohol dehydrogenase family)